MARSTSTAPVAVILAAGKGTRMKSRKPKVLVEALGRPLIAYPLELAARVGCRKVVVVVGHEAPLVREYVETWKQSFKKLVVVEQVPQLGTGHAVAQALPHLSKRRTPVLVLYGDVPLLKPKTVRRLLAAWRRRKAAVSMLVTELDDPGPYGRVVRADKGRVRQVVEAADDPDGRSHEVNVGTYVFDSAFLAQAVPRLGAGNAQGEFYLTDTVELAAASGLPVVTASCHPDEALGVNDRVDLALAEALLREEILEGHMLNGVSIPFPGSVEIHPDVSLGRDTVIGFGVQLLGRTKVGPDCRIESGSVLVDSTVGAGAWIKPYSVLEDAAVGRGCQVGPFAHLRPGTVLDAGAKVGNFVETKKAHLHAGVKANHLSYLGDCEVGRETNVGAGTITCNYDGRSKHFTKVGRNVFIGSDTQLVAPVEVGDGAVIGAGTTVMQDVPPDVVVVNTKDQRTWPRKTAGGSGPTRARRKKSKRR